MDGIRHKEIKAIKELGFSFSFSLLLALPLLATPRGSNVGRDVFILFSNWKPANDGYFCPAGRCEADASPRPGVLQTQRIYFLALETDDSAFLNPPARVRL